MTVLLVRIDQDDQGSRAKLQCTNCHAETYVPLLLPALSHPDSKTMIPIPVDKIAMDLEYAGAGHRC